MTLKQLRREAQSLKNAIRPLAQQLLIIETQINNQEIEPYCAQLIGKCYKRRITAGSRLDDACIERKRFWPMYEVVMRVDKRKVTTVRFQCDLFGGKTLNTFIYRADECNYKNMFKGCQEISRQMLDKEFEKFLKGML